MLLVGFLVLIGYVHLLTFQGTKNFGEDMGGFLLNLKLDPELEANSHNLKVTMAGALNSLTFIRVRHNAQIVRSTCPPLFHLHFWFSLLTWPDCI